MLQAVLESQYSLLDPIGLYYWKFLKEVILQLSSYPELARASFARGLRCCDAQLFLEDVSGQVQDVDPPL